ncbi:alpha-amylase family protein [Sphingosinicella terrae]|jgi:maltose alpha-D-glucosyltransferase / alpha-amylase|uniref:alpha-amylase family protein n=1 Tax=Sphingosinicella terrae TaxID=2172047 RepID=UPI000E0DF9A1|nr:alpha-amylase family protein [Sphingosinicella terrae]
MIRSLWYKNSVIYCLAVGSFMDSNGDGIGDFQGLARRLDYLHGLGVTALWLMPFQPSPRQDHGYDVTDHYSVDPRYGTLGDFVEFTHGCKERGMRVMIDLVINHTSDRHPWFRSARSDPASPYRDWYIWAKRKPKDAHKGMVFPGVQQATWDYDDVAKAWYFHRFFKFQPDLNYANAELRAEIFRILGFWIELGVSGFRLDAVPFVIAADDAEAGEPKLEYAMLRDFREFAQWRSGQCVMLAEANVPPKESIEYFGRDADRLHMMFNFPVNRTHFHAHASGDVRPLEKALRETRARPEAAQWCHFLRNHDELDLSQLEPEQMEATFAAFAPDEDMRLFGRGIRRRLAPMFGGDRRRIELANSLLLSLPGTPVIRYGDEIGMGEDLSLEGRDAVRTAMQWDDSPHGGFTTNARSDCPVIADGPYGYPHVNVAGQRRDPGSLLNWTERLIRLRHETPEIGYGAFDIVRAPKDILALRHEWRGAAVLTLHNFSDAPREIGIGPPATGGAPRRLVDLLDGDHSLPDEKGRHRILLQPYGYRWYRVGGLDEALERGEA